MASRSASLRASVVLPVACKAKALTAAKSGTSGFSLAIFARTSLAEPLAIWERNWRTRSWTAFDLEKEALSASITVWYSPWWKAFRMFRSSVELVN